MNPSEISPDYELKVRHHIRQTFLPYARKHITKDTVAYTESKLEQIFTESLDFIPLADPHALVLPPDPLDTLLKSINSLHLSFDERWTTDVDTIRRIKTILKSNAGEDRELRSEASWRKDDHLYTRLAEIYRPMTPILTNRARLQTPKPGSNTFRASLPRTQLALFEQIGVKPIVVIKIKELDLPKLEEVLNLRPTIDSTTRGYILSQVKSANPSTQSSKTNAHVASFLRADSPPLQIPRPLSPPLFPRSKAYSSSCGTGIWNSKDVAYRLNPVPVPVPDELEDDIDKVDMTIVDGWAVLPISSPPSASPLSSQDTDIDELWEASPSPLGTPATSILNARMDDVEIPRVYRPGHTLPSTADPMTAKTLKSFVDHLKLVAPTKSKEGNSATPTKPASTNAGGDRSLDAGDSMLGQPPSVCASLPLTSRALRDERTKSDRDPDLDSEDVEIDVGRSLDMALRYVYREVQEDNIEGCVLEERLDEKEVGLMNVPHLPPPTVHRGTSLQPTSMRALTGGGKGITTSINVPRHTTLECVKGIKPLNLELSWRPFKFTHPIPTDESVSLIEGPALDNLEKHEYADKASEAKIRGLLEDHETDYCCSSAKAVEPKNLEAIRGTGDIGLSPPPLSKRFGEEDGFELVLTKGERRFLAGLPELEDPQEGRGGDGDGDDRRERRQASLVTDESDQPAAHLADFHDDRDLRFGFVDSNSASSFLSNQGRIFGDPPLGLVFRDSGVVNHSDIVDDDLSVAIFDDDSGVALPIHQDEEGYHRDRGDAGASRYLDTVYSPGDIDDSDDGDKENNLYYVCPQMRAQDQEDEPFSSLPLSTQHQHGPSSYPTERRTLRGHGQDPIGLYSHNNPAESGFFPLSFGSQNERISRNPIEPVMISLDGDVGRNHATQSDHEVQNHEISIKTQPIMDKDDLENVTSFLRYFEEMDASTAAPASKRRRLDDPKTTTIATRAFLDDHLALRNKPVTHDPPPPATPMALYPQPQAPQTDIISPPRAAPTEILDIHTLRLPDIWNPPAASHCYLASIDVIQKRALIRALEAPECRVNLVERYVLDAVDVVMDQDTAVLLVPLLALPSHVEGLTDRILRASWRYSHILIIFEAFPSRNALSADTKNTNNANKLTLYAFSPPMLKAVKKLRRLVSIAESFGTKNAGCEIRWAFANDVGEAALFMRIFGDLAEERACNGSENILWGDRGWLHIDEHEDEADLAAVDGMNPFAAFVMLFQRSLQEILDMSPKRRVAAFSHLVGSQRIACLNAIIEQRAREMGVDAPTESGIGFSGMDVATDGSSTRYCVL